MSRARLRRPATFALFGILALGAALRAWFLLAYRPGFLGYSDAVTYIIAARGPDLWWNQYRPGGYPLFLRLVHLVSDHLGVTVAVQHALGLASAAALFLAVARFVEHRWVALLPAAVVAFSGAELFVEHSVLSEALFVALVAGALLASSRITATRVRAALAWLTGAGALAGAAILTRPVGVVLPLALVLWAAWRPFSRRGQRAGAAGAVLAGVLVVLGPYLFAQHHRTGTWGLTRTQGATLYARTAIFANCRDFRPPPGTRRLCERRPGSTRPNATFYVFDPSSPAARVFGMPPDPRGGGPGPYAWPPDGRLRAFALAALAGQPLGYLATTLVGLGKYVAPHAGGDRMLEYDNERLLVSLPGGPLEAAARPEVAAYYRGTRGFGPRRVGGLQAYARVANVEGPVTAVLVVLMLAGWVLARGRQAAGAALFGSTALALALAPVALLFYGTRYAVPVYGPLAAGAAVGLDAIVVRFGARSRRGLTPAAASPARR